MLGDQSLFTDGFGQPFSLLLCAKPLFGRGCPYGPAGTFTRSLPNGPRSSVTVDRGLVNRTSARTQTHPALFAAGQLVGQLRRVGISVTGHPGVGRAPRTSRVLATTSSPTVAQLTTLTNKPSDNYAAEMLFRVLGARASGTGSRATGAAAVSRVIARRLGIRPRIYDGSGQSGRNRTTPRELVRLLVGMSRQPVARQFQSSLPVVGRSGTLSGRLRRSVATGRCQAQDGTLTAPLAGTAAGYCRTLGGHTLAFAIMTNGLPVRIDQVTKNVTSRAFTIEDRMLTALAGFRATPSRATPCAVAPCGPGGARQLGHDPAAGAERPIRRPGPAERRRDPGQPRRTDLPRAHAERLDQPRPAPRNERAAGRVAPRRHDRAPSHRPLHGHPEPRARRRRARPLRGRRPARQPARHDRQPGRIPARRTQGRLGLALDQRTAPRPGREARPVGLIAIAEWTDRCVHADRARPLRRAVHRWQGTRRRIRPRRRGRDSAQSAGDRRHDGDPRGHPRDHGQRHVLREGAAPDHPGARVQTFDAGVRVQQVLRVNERYPSRPARPQRQQSGDPGSAARRQRHQRSGVSGPISRGISGFPTLVG